jgi:hypothetical protein
MMKKVIAGVITAGALSVPFAGIAAADPPSDRGNGGDRGNSADAPGRVVQDLRDLAADSGYTNLPEFLREESEYQSPGDIVSDIAQGELTDEELEELLAGLEPDDGVEE